LLYQFLLLLARSLLPLLLLVLTHLLVQELAVVAAPGELHLLLLLL
jgi:hypothetical protein